MALSCRRPSRQIPQFQWERANLVQGTHIVSVVALKKERIELYAAQLQT